jgi:protein SPA2
MISNSAVSNSGFSPSLHSVEEVKPLHQKKASSGAGAGSSSRRMDVFSSPGPRFGLWLHLLLLVGHLGRIHGDSRRSLLARIRTPPPLIFDQPLSRSTGRLLSDDWANVEGSEDAWAELKVRSSLVRLSKLLCM